MLVASSKGAYAHDEESTNRPADGTTTTSAAEMSPKRRAARLLFSDRKLITQRSETVAFYSDVMRDKVVLSSIRC
jgi:hypothetical protein